MQAAAQKKHGGGGGAATPGIPNLQKSLHHPEKGRIEIMRFFFAGPLTAADCFANDQFSTLLIKHK